MNSSRSAQQSTFRTSRDTGSDRFEADHVSAYLQYLGDHPEFDRLTDEQEFALAGKIDEHRWNMYGALFSIPAVADRYVTTLQQALAKNRSLDRMLDGLHPAEREQKEIFSQEFVPRAEEVEMSPLWVGKSVERVQLLLEKYRILYTDFLESESSDDCPTEEMEGCQKEISVLLREMRPKERIQRELLAYAQKLVLPPHLQKTLEDGRIHAGLYVEARNEMTNRNLRLVIPHASRYSAKKLDFMDLIQFGNTGLLYATGKYQRSRGTAFSTNATNWIRQSIFRSLYEESRTVRIPEYKLVVMRAIKASKARLFQTLQRNPTPEEIAEDLNLDSKDIGETSAIGKEVSLDMPIGEDQTPFGDFLSDTHEDVAVNIANKDEVHVRLGKLKDNERRVVKLRKGLQDGHEYTLEECAALCGLTHQYISQIEQRAMEKLQRGATSLRG